MDAPVTPASPHGAAAPAELVVVNGRLSGARRPLTGPLTLFGQAAGCEIHLTVEGIQPFHAALVRGPDGFLLRDLAGDGVLVNDRPAPFAPLRHGDEITVGPFRFRLEAPDPSGEQALEAERDALRVQAAAVAAQQTALTDEESRLDQRRGALERQEEQLAGRLDERRRRLLEIRDQTRQEREAFRAARAAAETELAAGRKQLQREKTAAAALAQEARDERRRLADLRKRLRRRWRRHWDAKDADLARREKELAAREHRLEEEAARLERTRAALTEERLRLNGDVELGRRRQLEEGQELALAQQQWEAALNHERADRERRERELGAPAAALAEAEHRWAGRERSVRLTVAELHREGAGLETRIRHWREQLTQEEAAVARLRAERGVADTAEAAVAHAIAPYATAVSAVSHFPAATPPTDTGAEFLGPIADQLADQRAHLLEQWQTLLRVEQEWRQGREQALAEMEAAGRSLVEREQRLLTRERNLDASAAELQQWQQSLSQLRYSLEGREARLKARDLAWHAERAAVTAEAQAREEAAALQLQRLRELARRRDLERGREAEEWAAALAQCEELRRHYVALWEECRRRRDELAGEQRDLAARTLAAEQVRLEVVGKAVHSARAERRMERLRRRNAARLEAAEREIDAMRKGLAAEGARLDDLAHRLQGRQQELAERRQELTREQAAWEERQAAAADAEERRLLEVRRLHVLREKDEQVMAQLRDEVERVAGLLLEQADDAAPAQAA